MRFKDLEVGDCFVTLNQEELIPNEYSIVNTIFLKTDFDEAFILEGQNSDDKKIYISKAKQKEIRVHRVYFIEKHRPIVEMDSIFLEMPFIRKRIIQKEKIMID
ncbi:MAG: hypothetical protein [Caudoviricetes sp.]|nr:MAG: hypothetical protein [Caudoviricetes sp.]